MSALGRRVRTDAQPLDRRYYREVQRRIFLDTLRIARVLAARLTGRDGRQYLSEQGLGQNLPGEADQGERVGASQGEGDRVVMAAFRPRELKRGQGAAHAVGELTTPIRRAGEALVQPQAALASRDEFIQPFGEQMAGCRVGLVDAPCRVVNRADTLLWFVSLALHEDASQRQSNLEGSRILNRVSSMHERVAGKVARSAFSRWLLCSQSQPDPWSRTL